jgi:Domain of unknown function (DUF4326)
METRVINIRELWAMRTLPPNHVYVGRAFYRNGWELPCSRWANPFKVEADDVDHSQACAKYAEYINRQDLNVLRPHLLALKGKTLVCWCKPKRCHADLLAQLADSLE